MKKSIILLFVFIAATRISYAQKIQNDSVKINYNKIYSYCLDGDVKTALTFLEFSNTERITSKDLKFKTQFENRFKYTNDKSDYLANRTSPVTELLKIYRNYWRVSLLDNSQNHDTTLVQNVAQFLIDNCPPAHKLMANEDSLNIYLKKYIQSFDLYTTGFGKTGKYFDLLVWASEKDTTYSFLSRNEKTSAQIVFMDDFITLGWEEYATLDEYYPGGWATKKALYCVKKAYDLNSEEFMISYLAHESRHFADYKLFPKLQSADLEYRAKLTEVSMAQKTLYEILESFINNANYESENGHSIANYSVVRDLSKALFNVEFEKDISKWKQLSIGKINETAYEILLANTEALKKQGSGVERYIKK